MKQFLVFLLLAVVLLCCGCRQESSMKDWGEQVKENQSIPDTDAVASVNGVPISKERYENYKVGLQNAQGKFTDEQVKTYTEMGGTPFLDNQYTVFGEVEEGLDVVEKIQNCETLRGDRPKEDISMVVSLIEE